MHLLDCAIGETLLFGDDIRVQLIGRVDDALYVFVDAAEAYAVESAGGFCASAPCGDARDAHVLSLRSGERFVIGPLRISVDAVRLVSCEARLLRDVRLSIGAPSDLPPVRANACSVGRRPARFLKERPCWS